MFLAACRSKTNYDDYDNRCDESDYYYNVYEDDEDYDIYEDDDDHGDDVANLGFE